MNHSQLIDELLQELSYRVGIVDIYNKEQQSIMSEILTEWGEYGVKETIFRFLNEDDEKRFKNPLLNRKITYVGKDGKEREGLVGNLLTSPKDSPGRIEAERLLPPEGSDERNAINQEIGSQGGGGPQDDTKGGGTDNVEQDTQRGSAVKKGTKSGDSYQKNRVSKEQETQEKIDAENDDSSDIKVDNNNFSQKSEATEGLFAGKSNYRTIEIGGKSSTVRPLIDPKTGNPLDTSNSEDRKRAIEIIEERLSSLEEKGLNGIKILEQDGVPKTQRTAILKWLGEVGELQAYLTLLKSDKVKDVYMLTDSEPKNDLVVIGENEERNLFLQGISVKTTEIDTMANKRGSSVKPDLENALNEAERRTVKIPNVDGDVDGSVILNSYLELRKRIIKEISEGKVRQNPETKESEVVLEDGKVVSITEFFRRGEVTVDIINKIFDNDKLFQGRYNPIRSLTGDFVDEVQIKQLRAHFKNKFIQILEQSGGKMTITDLQDRIEDEFIQLYDELGANLTPATDTMVSYYDGNGFVENKVIPKEDSQRKIMEVLGVDDFSQIDKKTQFKTILGLDWTGRGHGKKKEGKGHIDGQSFGRPSPKLTSEPRTMDEYIQNVLK